MAELWSKLSTGTVFLILVI